MKTIFEIHKNYLNNYNSCGVYRFDCGCDMFYIGKTNRHILIRYKEHLF